MTIKNDYVFLKHIMDSIEAIESFSFGLTRDGLSKDRLKQSAIIREIEVIGEAVRNISEKTKQENTQVLWKEIIGTRDKMIHHYFGVDLNIVWEIVTKDLPILKKQISEIVKKEEKLKK